MVVPEGVFRITNALIPRANQQIEIVGTIKVADANIQPLAADVPAGQPRVPVPDASGFYAGQWVTMADESLRIQGGGKNKVRREGGDCGRIARIEGNTLVMELNLRRGYSVAAKARVGTQPSAILITQSNVYIRGRSVIDGIGAHDKNIFLRHSEGCRVAGIRGMDSQFEDGIILYSGNRHCVVQGNMCTGNARLGICVNAFQTGILLSGNICVNNLTNFSIRGDHGSSTGDFSSGGRVNVEGRGNVISGLISLGTVSISATDLTYDGCTIGGDEGNPLAVAMNIARNSIDRRVALVDRGRIRGVTFRGCTTAVRVSGVVKDVRLLNNRFQCEGPAVVVAEECRAEVSYARNEGYATENSDTAAIPAPARKVTVAHGLQIAPRLADISVTPASSLGKAARFCIARPHARDSTSVWMPNRAGRARSLSGELVRVSDDAEPQFNSAAPRFSVRAKPVTKIIQRKFVKARRWVVACFPPKEIQFPIHNSEAKTR